MLSDALAAADPARHGSFAGEAAVALADAGLADDVRAKVTQNTERWPGDARARMLADDAPTILGDTEAALASALCDFLPLAENRVTLDSETDAYGLPVVRFSYSQCDNDRAHPSSQHPTDPGSGNH